VPRVPLLARPVVSDCVNPLACGANGEQRIAFWSCKYLGYNC